MRLHLAALLILVVCIVRAPCIVSAQAPAPTAELDAFMAQVLTKRDENWKKVQQ